MTLKEFFFPREDIRLKEIISLQDTQIKILEAENMLLKLILEQLIKIGSKCSEDIKDMVDKASNEIKAKTPKTPNSIHNETL